MAWTDISLPPLSDNTIYANQIANVVIEIMERAFNEAGKKMSDNQTLLDDLQTVLDAATATKPVYSPDLTGISFEPAAPTETGARPDFSADMPDNPAEAPTRGSLLTDAQWDDIYNRDNARRQRDAEGLVHDAMYQTAGLGIGLTDGAKEDKLAKANEAITRATSAAAGDRAALEAEASRQDMGIILQQETAVFTSKLNKVIQQIGAETQAQSSAISLISVQVATDQSRLQWMQTELGQIMDEARVAAVDVDLNYMNTIVQKTNTLQSGNVGISANAMQSFLALANPALGMSGSQSVSDNSS